MTSVPFLVKALSPYQSRNNNEVSLVVGQIYTVFQTDGKGHWWQTKGSNGRPGWFPASYTQIVEQGPIVTSTVPPVMTIPTLATPTVTTSAISTNISKPIITDTPRQALPLYTSNKITMKTVSIQKIKTESVSLNEEVPPPSKPPKIEKTASTCYLLLQIVEAKNLKPVDGSESKTHPTAFVFRREVLDDGKGEKLFNTSTRRKTVSPRWNEKFRISVCDAEDEVICIRICSGAKHPLKGKNFLGEILFPLIGSVRDFDYPGFQFKWYPISNSKGSNSNGEVKIFIQYKNTKAVGKPTDVKHVSSINWSQDGGFDIKNIPIEWKQIFQRVGIKKKDLEENPELAKNIINIMTKAQEEGGGSVSINKQVDTTPIGVNAPTPPESAKKIINIMTKDQEDGGGSVSINKQVDTTPIGVNAPTPPPPPMDGPKAHLNNFGADTSVSKTTLSVGSGPTITAPHSSSTGFLDQIKLGTQLRKVDITAERPPAEGGSTLLSTLQSALQNYRKDIEGDDQEDWSNDWSEEDY